MILDFHGHALSTAKVTLAFKILSTERLEFKLRLIPTFL